MSEVKKMGLSEINIEECLKDAGCSHKKIQEIMECIKNKNDERKMMLLKKHRCHLLYKIHHDQQQIDCLDYLLYNLKKDKQ